MAARPKKGSRWCSQDAVKADVPLHHDAAAGGGEARGQMLLRRGRIAREELMAHARDALRRLQQALARGVLADTFQKEARGLLDLSFVHFASWQR